MEPLTLAPVERLSDRLAALLAQQIEAGRMRPGDRLPTEAQLASEHGVSRSVVREAVHQVRSQGLLVSRQGSGMFVAAPPPRGLTFDPKVLESVEAVLQVLELRRVIEGEMSALAATRATRAEIAALKRALKAIDTANEKGELGLTEDFELHRAIGAATHNPQFVRLLAFIEQYLLDGMRVTKSNEARREEWVEQVRGEHRAIVDAIAARDPEGARRAAIRHHQRGEQRLKEGGVAAEGKSRRRASAG
ncbi:FadR/GntR family transcriptional regulator [Aquincola sp. MAHUQ-54]|uniref:FadR/GntR family transcriptional regulator n=1 Tax=Aquincola agrisoli TaxID=3119538 RepID=A0AAW9Q9I2_9BURK